MKISGRCRILSDEDLTTKLHEYEKSWSEVGVGRVT